jgi:glycosyltransferase involved in cell wall biosynthesis
MTAPNAPRIVFVTRRFWPLLGGAETMIGNLAAALVNRGMKATILTACWEPHWPREIVHRSVRVVRLPQPPNRVVGTWCYMRELAGWLGRHRDEFNLVYVSQLKHDAYVAVRVGNRLRFPVILRATGAGGTGDCHWHKIGRCGYRIRRQVGRADALIAPSPAIEAELLAAGFAAERLVRLDSGVPIPESRTAARRKQAREMIGGSNAALSLDDKSLLAVYTGRLHAAKGLAHLIDAWATVVQQRPDARLWLVGEGPEHAALERQIHSLRLVGRVTLVGSFDSVEDMLLAADVFVLPSFEEGLSIALLEAMAIGMPVIASDISGNRRVVQDDLNGLLVPSGNSATLAQAIERVFTAPDWAAELGAAARRHVEEHYSLDRMVEEHLNLFRRLVPDAS